MPNHHRENIYSSQIIQALEQKYCSSCSAAVVSSCLVSSQGLGARVVSRIYDGGRKAVYTAAVAAMMAQNLTPAAYAASMVVSNGETSTGLVMPNSSGVTDLKISNGGTTISTTLNDTGKEIILGGGVASGTIINAGGSQAVSGNNTSNGRAIDTVINGGKQTVAKNGVANSTHISEGGVQSVLNSGVAIGTQISFGGVHSVAAGGSSLNFSQLAGGILRLTIASGTYILGQDATGQTLTASEGSALGWTLNDGVSQTVANGGSASSTQISSGGLQTVANGGSALDTVILFGGVQAARGYVSNTTIQEGGQQKISSGGTVYGTYVSSGGVQYLYSGANAQDTTLASGAKQNVSSAGVASNTIVSSGATQTVYQNGSSLNVSQMVGGNINLHLSGGATTLVTGTNQNGEDISVSDGIATNFIINDGGSQYILSGASAVNTIVNSGGVQKISGSGIGGGTALNTTVNNGGSQTVNSGGAATSTTVNSGGFQGVYSGGVASDTQVLAGGKMTLGSGGASANNTVVASQGAMSIGHGASATDITIQSGGVMGIVVRGGEGTYITGSHEGRGTFLLSDGVASNFVISSYDNGIYGVFGVSSGGEALDTLLIGESARQSVQNGGVASNTTMSGGNLTIRDGGVVDTVTAYGGKIGIDADSPVQIVGNATLSGTLVNLAVVSSASMATLGSRKLSIENLSADGAVFNMSVDLENQTGDLLTVQSAYNGNAQIQLTNIGASAQETSDDGIKIVEFSDPSNVNGTFSLVGGRMEEGAYAYELAQGTQAGEGKDYFLRSVDYADIFKTMLNIPVMNVMVAQTGMNSLQRRLGDLHNMDNTDKKHGVWVRSYYRDVTVNDLAKTDMRLFGAEAGYDWLFRADEPTKLYAGVLVGYVDMNSLETRKQSGAYEKGEGESPSAGVYATLVNEAGWFVDIAARNFWTKLDIDSHNGGGTTATYSPKRNVLAVSAETGKNFVHTLSRDRFVRIEPKAEVGWMNAASGDTTVHNGVGDLHYQETNYLNGKGAVLISYNTKYGKDLLIEPLVELAYRYEFDGKGNISYGGATEKSDMSGGSLEVNAGLNMQLTKDLYWYALGSYENGKKIEGWGVYAGVRYKFGGGEEKVQPAPKKEVPSAQIVEFTMVPGVPQTTVAEIVADEKQPEAVSQVSQEKFYVLFGFNSYKLSQAARQKIADFAKSYVNDHDTRTILLEGYSCDIGPERASQEISFGRAESVRRALVDSGVVAKKIKMKTYGATQFAKKGFGGRKDYRRVVISVVGK